MTEVTGILAEKASVQREKGHAPWHQRTMPCVLAVFAATCAAMLMARVGGWGDYVGPDNDDVMRLVEVRDLLAGQAWFDLMQYRLGPGSGTLMHWSRLIDLPIATLIGFFSLFLERDAAEAVALTIWPMSLILPLLMAIAIGARRIGGVSCMHVALLFGFLLTFISNRFRPGAIDHHNVQLVLAIIIAAVLVDPLHRRSGYIIAGVAAAVAIAIGAETMPFIAACCLCVAVRWAVTGDGFSAAARAFGLSLTVAISAIFFLTTPRPAWSVVTCDSLSLGFYGLASIGGSLLFLSATFTKGYGLAARLAILGVNGLAVLGSAVVLAPECLGNPLSGLDPLLIDLWLSGISEAQSFRSQLQLEPETLGVFYAPGLLAIFVCAWRVLRGDRRSVHAVMLALIATCWAVALVQVRGAIFANLLSILPLALLVSELREKANREPQNVRAALAFAGTTLASVPVAWVALAALLTMDWRDLAGFGNGQVSNNQTSDAGAGVCEVPQAFTQLASLPPGLIVVPSDSGAELLRYTHHSTLTGPYHRNQAGMLTEIHIGISRPDEALAFIRDAKISVVAFCPSDGMTQRLMNVGPDGLYAALAKGNIPAWLEAMPADPTSGFRLYKVRPASG